jgi:hypothetical protein
MIQVSVSGLSNVATHTALVTKLTAPPNSSASIVVMTAVGIEDCSTPA